MTTPNLKISLLAAMFTAAAVSSFGATVYWKGNDKSSGMSFTDTWGWSTGAFPAVVDDVVLDETYITGASGNGYVVDGFFGGNTTWNSLKINYETKAIDKKINCSSGKDTTVNILQDVVKTGLGTARFAMGSGGTTLNLNVGGNISVGTDKNTQGGVLFLGSEQPYVSTDWGGPLDSLRVGGNVTVNNVSQLSMNVVGRAGASTYENPDAYIGGLLIGAGSGEPAYDNPGIALFNVDTTKRKFDQTSIVSVEAIIGSGVLRASNYGGASEFKTLAVLYLRGEQAKTYTFDGWTGDVGDAASAVSQLKIVKDGISTQRFTASKYKFTGGLEVRGGVLEINGTADGKEISHGDLTMVGGKFAFAKTKADFIGKEYFGFTDLVYSDGKLVLNVATDSIDKILLTGTIKAADIGSKGIIKIELGGADLSYLESDYRLLIGMGTATSDYTDADFLISNLDTSKYSADFDVRSDGVYLKLSTIPEPAAVAAVLGALALVFALRRRK